MKIKPMKIKPTKISLYIMVNILAVSLENKGTRLPHYSDLKSHTSCKYSKP